MVESLGEGEIREETAMFEIPGLGRDRTISEVNEKRISPVLNDEAVRIPVLEEPDPDLSRIQGKRSGEGEDEAPLATDSKLGHFQVHLPLYVSVLEMPPQKGEEGLGLNADR